MIATSRPVFRNRFLAGLHDADYQALAPHLSSQNVSKGRVLIEQDDVPQIVHFPETAVLSNLLVFSDGATVDTAQVGLEGLSGLAALLAEASITWRVVVQLPGLVYALPASILRTRIQQSRPFYNRIVRLVHDYQSQAGQNSACNAAHSNTQRLARWLLMVHDRSRDEALRMTQQDLADVLGLPRTSVTESAMKLKQAGALSYARGVIRLNRVCLEPLACECYFIQTRRSRQLDGLLDGLA